MTREGYSDLAGGANVDGPWELPIGWRWERLGDVAEVNPKTDFATLSSDADVAFLPMAAVSEETGEVAVSIRRRISEVAKGFTRFRSGDVLFAKITPCMENGKVAVVPETDNGFGAGSTEFHVIRSQTLYPKFTFYFLVQRGFRDEARRNMSGSAGQLRVPKDYLRNVQIPVPPRSAQRRIVARINELFAEIEEGEQALTEVRTGVETYRKALLKAAVTGELTSDWRSQNSRVDTDLVLRDRILRDRLTLHERRRSGMARRLHEPCECGDQKGNLPPGWVWMSLDQLAWSSQYGTSIKCSSVAVGEPVLRIPNMRYGAIDLTDLKFASERLDRHPDDYVAPGDLLFVRTNGSSDLIGRAAIVLDTLGELTFFASYLIRFRLTGDRLRWTWVQICCESVLFRSYVEQNIASSAGQYNLSMGSLASFSIPMPPDAEMVEILTRLAASKIAYTQDANASSDLRQSILSAAFRGELAA